MQKSTSEHKSHEDAGEVATRHLEAMMQEIAARNLCSDCALSQLLAVVSLNIVVRGTIGAANVTMADIADFGGYVARLVAGQLNELAQPGAEYSIRTYQQGGH